MRVKILRAGAFAVAMSALLAGNVYAQPGDQTAAPPPTQPNASMMPPSPPGQGATQAGTAMQQGAPGAQPGATQTGVGMQPANTNMAPAPGGQPGGTGPGGDTSNTNMMPPPPPGGTPPGGTPAGGNTNMTTPAPAPAGGQTSKNTKPGVTKTLKAAKN